MDFVSIIFSPFVHVSLGVYIYIYILYACVCKKGKYNFKRRQQTSGSNVLQFFLPTTNFGVVGRISTGLCNWLFQHAGGKCTGCRAVGYDGAICNEGAVDAKIQWLVFRKLGEWKLQIETMLSFQSLADSQKTEFMLGLLEGEAKRETMALQRARRDTSEKIFDILLALYDDNTHASILRTQFFNCR